MFDELTPIKRGAVVSCRFPLAEAENTPGPSARPALILRTFFDKGVGAWKAIVAYGTSRSSRANAGFEVRVKKPEHLAQAGLHRNTRFTMSRMRILPIDEKFFAYNQAGTPVLGYLTDDLMTVLDRNCERLIAISDDLRPLMGGWSAQVASKTVESTGTDATIDFNVGHTDAFFLQSCTGRQNLNGAAEGSVRRTAAG